MRTTRILFSTVSLAMFLLALTMGLVRKSAAAPSNTAGSLDGSFGSGGKVITDFAGGPDSALSVALQPDGKMVVAGYATHFVVGTGYDYDFALARYNTNGSLDPSFGSGGKVTTDFGGSDSGLAMALQPDGKIVVVGGSCLVVNNSCPDTSYKFALARYNGNGSLDTTCGSSGKVTTDLPGTTKQPWAWSCNGEMARSWWRGMFLTVAITTSH